MSRLTFQQLETFCGIPQRADGTAAALDEWYASVRAKPLSSLTDGDMARAVRQKLFLQYSVQETIRRLRLDPLAGDKYDGELMGAFGELASADWRGLGPEVLGLVHGTWQSIAEAVEDENDADPFLRKEARKVSEALRRAMAEQGISTN